MMCFWNIDFSLVQCGQIVQSDSMGTKFYFTFKYCSHAQGTCTIIHFERAFKCSFKQIINSPTIFCVLMQDDTVTFALNNSVLDCNLWMLSCKRLKRNFGTQKTFNGLWFIFCCCKYEEKSSDPNANDHWKSWNQKKDGKWSQSWSE